MGRFLENSSPGFQFDFGVTIIDDNIAEPTEEIIVAVTLATPQQATAMFVGGGLSHNATILIIDDESKILN